MAASISFSSRLDPHHHHLQPNRQPRSLSTHIFKPLHTLPITPAHPLLLVHKYRNCKFHSTFSSSHSSSPSPSSSESYLNDPLRTGWFLSTEEVEKLQILQNFRYSCEVSSGSLLVRLMGEEEMDITVGLLSDSFAESMSLPLGYVRFLAFLVNQYMTERRALIPHAATLVGFYRGEDGEEELAGTVEVSFNRRGANASPPTPTPPKDSPYICNMTVKKPLRR